ncbi:NAD(P)/FAD-dependent oxidoreductase [Kitasatospora nipponensis]|uniref:NAD(P)/FAD-dependent oxidoreductase n=1 Tax=Kitasatospora nipponensis TaxID=258049 RepID=A0ABP4GH56_9ACTN
MPGRVGRADSAGRDPESCDVLVAGGGPAGAAAALTLARAGRTVLLADAGTGPPRVGEALPSAARLLLHDLGAGEGPLTSGHLTCYANLSAWGSPLLGGTDFIHDPNGPGWHLDRARFDRALRAAAQRAGARFAARTAVRGVTRRADGTWSVALRGPGGAGVVRCRWLVDATGRRRAVAARCGATRHRTDRLVAAYLTLPPGGGAGALDASSLVESAEDGWWYTALLPGGRRLVAYFTDADLAPPLPGPQAFLRLLRGTRHVADRAGRHPAPTEVPPGRAPRRASAHSSHLGSPSGEGWTAVGDAAAAFDPISAQGILTALHTGMTGAHAVHAHLDGDPTALDTYRAHVGALLAAYRHNHRTVYAAEPRWADRPFWRRRRPTALR